MVQNCDINMNDVKIPKTQKLPQANKFSAAKGILQHSRIFVCFLAAGMAMGIYDNVIKYST